MFEGIWQSRMYTHRWVVPFSLRCMCLSMYVLDQAQIKPRVIYVRAYAYRHTRLRRSTQRLVMLTQFSQARDLLYMCIPHMKNGH